MPSKLDGSGVAAIGFGALFLWAGIKGYSILQALGNIVKGASPNQGQSTSLLTVPNSGAVTPSTGQSNPNSVGNAVIGGTGANTSSANQQLAKNLAVSMGHSDWTTGQEWTDWVSLWNQESGWSITAANPTSSARGIAQNINGYGPDYLEGNAVSQITWGINYISGRYGNPSVAEAHERANNWY